MTVSDDTVEVALAAYLADNAAGAERDEAMRTALRAVIPSLLSQLAAAVKAIETGNGSKHYQHGRDTMREDVLLAIDSLTPGVEWS